MRNGSGLMMKMILIGMMKVLTAFILFKSMECNWSYDINKNLQMKTTRWLPFSLAGVILHQLFVMWNDMTARGAPNYLSIALHASCFMSTMWTMYSCQIKSLLSYFIFNHLFLIMLDVAYRIFLFDDLFLLLIVLLKEGKLGI